MDKLKFKEFLFIITLYNKGGIDSDRLLEENITSIYKNKVIILDNASSHRNDKIKKVIEKDYKL
jgi:hypothetical protein